ncbi:MAG: CpaF family protein, partial [Sciscionella sp.]
MTYPTHGYPPPVSLRPHQQPGQPHCGWPSPGAPGDPGSRGPVQPTGYPSSSLAAQAAPGGAEPVETTEAVGRLRQHLRDTLGSELPQWVDAQQRRTGSPVTRES